MTDPICTCGHPESQHADGGLFGRGRCRPKDWWESCSCRAFAAAEDTDE